MKAKYQFTDVFAAVGVPAGGPRTAVVNLLTKLLATAARVTWSGVNLKDYVYLGGVLGVFVVLLIMLGFGGYSVLATAARVTWSGVNLKELTKVA